MCPVVSNAHRVVVRPMPDPWRRPSNDSASSPNGDGAPTYRVRPSITWKHCEYLYRVIMLSVNCNSSMFRISSNVCIADGEEVLLNVTSGTITSRY